MKRVLVVSAILVAGWSVEGQDGAREIWDAGFRQKRPSRPASAEQRKTAPAVDYRVGAGPAPAPSTTTRVVGVTIWRLRAAAATDTAPRLLVQDLPNSASQSYVAERVSPSEGLKVGERVRIGIEVAERGFLYIIDREGYDDGSSGPPHLVFPARNLSGGDNRVEPGRLIEIPAQGDPLPALRVIRQNPRHVREDLTIILTTSPLPGIMAGEPEVRLPDNLVATWERLWGSGDPLPRLDLIGGSGRALWSAQEQEAGLAKRLLTQDDPMPGSLYQASLKGDGALVRVSLPIK
jgi:hypothetical protein